MNKKLAIIISPNWKDYAQKYLADCLDSIRSQRLAGEFKLFLIDNESGAESFAYLQSLAPEAEILRNEKNEGFAKGNNDAMQAALAQGFDYLLLVNIDTVLAPGCLQNLINAAESKTVGAVQARLMLWDRQDQVNSLGNVSHFLGFGYSLGYQQKYNPQAKLKTEIAYPSGAGVLFRAEVLRIVGLFDEEFWMYNEDQDLGWRIWLAGYRCIVEPTAVIYHKYEFGRSIQKYYWMDRNRLLVILKNYRLLSLILILPALIIMEFGLLLFAIMRGWLPEKLKIYQYFLRPGTWRYVFRARNQAQALRRVPDRRIISLFVSTISYQEIDSIILRLANIFFQIYWLIARHLIFW